MFSKTNHSFHKNWLFLSALIIGPILLNSLDSLVAMEARPTPFQIDQKEIHEFQSGNQNKKIFGSLEFLGGLELSSSNSKFGGISGLLSLNDGQQYLAVSDSGHWFHWDFEFAGKNSIGAISNATLAPILNEHGLPAESKSDVDAEALTMQLEDGVPKIYVAYEGKNWFATWYAPVLEAMVSSAKKMIPKNWKFDFPINKGIESLAAAPKNSPLSGAIIALAERNHNDEDNISGLIFGGPQSGNLMVKRRDNYDLTDAAFLQDGDLLILERRFSIFQGWRMRIRRITGATIRPDAILDGEVIIETESGQNIDNMEALAVHRTANGNDILTIMSDDNQSFLQKTLLLRFKLLQN